MSLINVWFHSLAENAPKSAEDEFAKLRRVTASRHFSHMTKSRIFKNLNLRTKADRNFRRTFLKNRFRYIKLHSNPPT